MQTIMNLQVLSDLHLEFIPAPMRLAFLQRLKVENVDAVVLAGDVATHDCLRWALEWFCGEYADVIFVPGNHEYFGSNFEAVRSLLRLLSSVHDNLHVLDNDVLVLHGQRIVGSTLWFPNLPGSEEHAHLMSDFEVIEDFAQLVYDAAAQAEVFLREEVQQGDVVVTHHLPSYRSVHERFHGSELNRFFVFALDELVQERRPALWVHGHTHFSCDYELGATRVLCNPHGYMDYGGNTEFKPGLVVEVAGGG